MTKRLQSHERTSLALSHKGLISTAAECSLKLSLLCLISFELETVQMEMFFISYSICFSWQMFPFAFLGVVSTLRQLMSDHTSSKQQRQAYSCSR